MSETTLDQCDCCEGTQPFTPQAIANRPGLDALYYRVGTHAAFLETMKARLSSLYLDIPSIELDENGHQKIDHFTPLSRLTTRSSDDPSIALLDAWATVADVLTLYQERIANEGYLRTATERRSVLELARLVGYRLRPGVASSVYLAYTLEDTQKDPVIIPTGAKAQSVPTGPDDQMQTFETSEPLEARASWNILKPRMRRPQIEASIRGHPDQGFPARVYLKGTDTNVKPGDPLLIVFDGAPQLYRICKVETDAVTDRTRIELELWKPIQTSGQVVRSQKAFQEISERYSDLAAFRVSGTSRTAQQSLKLLRELKDADPAKAAKIQDGLGRLLEAIQGNPRASRLQEWLSAMMRDLDEALQLSVSEVDETATTRLPFSKQIVTLRDPLEGVLSGLVTARSVPPRNTLYLRRDASRLLARRTGDASVQILKAFRPDLGETLPVAMANTRATPDSSIQVYALRVKASLFGHNAPLKPILDSSGRVIDHEEWPLAGTRVFSVRMSRIATGGGVLITIAQGNDTISVTAPIPDESNRQSQVTLGNETVVITSGFTGGGDPAFVLASLKFEIQASQYALTIDFQGNPAGSNFSVKLERAGVEEFNRNVPPNQTLRERVNGHKVTIIRSGFGVTVADEALRVPDPLNRVDLDSVYDQITPGGWIAILRADAPASEPPLITSVVSNETISRADYGITGKITRLEVGANWLKQSDRLLTVVRGTSVLAQSQELFIAEEPVTSDICNGAGTSDADWIELDALYSDLKSGRWVVISGERTDLKDTNSQPVSGVKGTELVMLADVIQDVAREDGTPYYYLEKPPSEDTHPDSEGEDEAQSAVSPILAGDKLHTWIRLAKNLAYCYKREAVTLYGNVVKATHGETSNEVFSGGDAGQALQTFELRQRPLTYVASPTPAGAQAALKVYVNEVQWHEADTLAWLGPTDHNYIIRIDDDGKIKLVFGTGEYGARLPTGQENVKAVYRKGIGKPGNVQAGQISQLATRPLGVKSVINPLRASGGADRESRDQARVNAPLTVMALDRLVSVQDYADFARTFAGIGKAVARRVSDSQRELVHVTIAGIDDIPIDETSDLYRNLLAALRRFGDPVQPFLVQMRELRLLVISANIQILPDYQWDVVAPAIRGRLLETFSFQRRELGQDVLASEALSAMQAVKGVAYVDLEVFGVIPEKLVETKMEAGKPVVIVRLLTTQEIAAEIQKLLDQPKIDLKDPKKQHLGVGIAEIKGGVIRPAQLALLSPQVPDTLILNRIEP